MRPLAIAAALALAGCATTATDPATIAEANTPLVCANAAQCDVYWKRAQSWVATHSYWHVQTVSDAIIQTYGPGDSAFMAYTITREQHADGGARIVFNWRCGSPFGCFRDPISEAASFKRFVKG